MMLSMQALYIVQLYSTQLEYISVLSRTIFRLIKCRMREILHAFLDKFVSYLKLLEFFNLGCSISHFVHLYEQIVSLYG